MFGRSYTKILSPRKESMDLVPESGRDSSDIPKIVLHVPDLEQYRENLSNLILRAVHPDVLLGQRDSHTAGFNERAPPAISRQNTVLKHVGELAENQIKRDLLMQIEIQARKQAKIQNIKKSTCTDRMLASDRPGDLNVAGEAARLHSTDIKTGPESAESNQIIDVRPFRVHFSVKDHRKESRNHLPNIYSMPGRSKTLTGQQMALERIAMTGNRPGYPIIHQQSPRINFIKGETLVSMERGSTIVGNHQTDLRSSMVFPPVNNLSNDIDIAGLKRDSKASRKLPVYSSAFFKTDNAATSRQTTERHHGMFRTLGELPTLHVLYQSTHIPWDKKKKVKISSVTTAEAMEKNFNKAKDKTLRRETRKHRATKRYTQNIKTRTKLPAI